MLIATLHDDYGTIITGTAALVSQVSLVALVSLLALEHALLHWCYRWH